MPSSKSLLGARSKGGASSNDEGGATSKSGKSKKQLSDDLQDAEEGKGLLAKSGSSSRSSRRGGAGSASAGSDSDDSSDGSPPGRPKKAVRSSGRRSRLEGGGKDGAKSGGEEGGEEEDDGEEADDKAGEGTGLMSRFRRRGGEKKGAKDKSEGGDADKENMEKEGRKKDKSKKALAGKKNNLELLAAGLSRFVPLDKDVKGKPIHVSEMAAFVKVDMSSDGTGALTNSQINDLLRDIEDDKARGKDRQLYVYVESASSGRFFKYASDGLSGGGPGGSGHSGHLGPSGAAGPSATDEYLYSREAAMEQLEQLLSSVFIALQGLLAGYSGQTVYQSFTTTTNGNFLKEYARLANDTRRFYFVLLTLCFVGAMNNWGSAKRNKDEWRRKRTVEKVEFVFLVATYVVALCFGLVIGVSDITFSLQDGILAKEIPTGKEWYDVALDDKDFRTLVANWKSLCIGRFLSCLIGWLVVCRVLHRSSSRATEAVRSCEQLSATLSDSSLKIAQLTGLKLDNLTREDLMELSQIQRTALEQTNHVLSNLPTPSIDSFATAQTPMLSPRSASAAASSAAALAGASGGIPGSGLLGGASAGGGVGGGATSNPMLSMGGGFGGGALSPTRSRAQSVLPPSISSKAPPNIFTAQAGGEGGA